MASGLMWTVANSWSVQAINLGVFLLLARLLEPSSFGLVAMAGVYVHISGILADQGLSTAVIQRPELEPEHLDTAFWMGTGLGAALTGLGILLSGPIAALYGTPALQPVVALLSWNFLINSVGGVQQALLSRRFAFKQLAVRSLTAAVLGGTVSVVLAFRGYGVYALVMQQLTTSLAGTILLWSVGRWVPGFRISVRHGRELLSFGMNVVGIRLLNAISRRSDDLLIGYFLGPVALGYYTVAYKIFKVMVEVFTKVVSKVALPTFSALQSSVAELSAAFSRSMKGTALVAFPMFVGMGVLAPQLIPGLFGEQWTESVPVMQVLALMGVLQAVHLMINQVMLALGRPNWVLRFLVINTVASVVGFAFAVRWGILAVAIAYTVTGYVLTPIYVTMLRRLLGLGWMAFLGQLRTASLASAAMAAAMLAALWAMPQGMPDLGAAALAGALGAAVYLVLTGLLEPAFVTTGARFCARRIPDGSVRRWLLDFA